MPKTTRVCHECHEKFQMSEMVNYASPTCKTSYWYCQKCYQEKVDKDNLRYKLCEIFGIQQVPPATWAYRKKLIEQYGYTDNTIIECLEYLYNVEHINKKGSATFLGYVNPANVNKMMRWKNREQNVAASLVRAINDQNTKIHLVNIKENTASKNKILTPDEIDEMLGLKKE